MRGALAFAVLILTSNAFALKIERITTTPATRVQGADASGTFMDVVAEQAMVRFAPSVSISDHASRLAAVGAGVIREFPSINFTQVSLAAGTPVATGLIQLRALPGVEIAEANRVYYPSVLPTDTQFVTQYALQQIDAPGGWAFEKGDSSRVTILVGDTGIQGDHPELEDKIVSGGGAQSQYCNPNGAACVVNDPPTPACSHGTQVAGVAAAKTNNASGIAGVSWGAQLLSMKIFDDADCNPGGNCPQGCGTDDAAVINAVNYAIGINNLASVGRVVMNFSIGCTPGNPGCNATCPVALQTAFGNAVAAGIPIIISAGNDAGPVNSPAFCAPFAAGVIPVGATTADNGLAYFSSRGTVLANHGVVAPGMNIFTTSSNSGYAASVSGTSFAAPHVAGLAALVLSARPTATAAQVQTMIRGGADKVGLSSELQGAGRINVFKTLRLASRGTLSDFDGEKKVVAFPNPFRVSDSGTMSFTLPPSLQGSNSKIKIFTAAGELVREISGLVWDGKNEGGSRVASGTYLFHVETSAGKSRGRFAVIR